MKHGLMLRLIAATPVPLDAKLRALWLDLAIAAVQTGDTPLIGALALVLLRSCRARAAFNDRRSP